MKKIIKLCIPTILKMVKSMKYEKKKIDYFILILIFMFLAISYLSISSSMLYLPSYLGNLAIKQVLFYVLGFIISLTIFFLPKKVIDKCAYPFYIFCNILLFLLLIFGTSVNGSKCWFIIPGIGSIQPSEFTKISLILVLAKEADKFFKKGKRTVKEEFIFLLKILILVLIPSILTFLEPDTGAIFMYLMIIFGVLLISPLRKRWFVFAISTCFLVLGIFFSLYFLKQDFLIDILGTDVFYRIDRILDWKNGSGMQLENSLTSIGSSSIFGHGYKNTPLYFPESGTDFIFSVFASNFGLIGAYVLLLLFFIFDIHLIKIAKENKSQQNKYIISGFLLVLFYQQMQNISMTLGLLPITGITLPFISYGGSSLLSYFIMIGIILNIYGEANKKKKSIY